MNDASQNMPEKMPLISMDIAEEKKKQLKRCLAAAFPEIVAEDKIDLDQLKRVLGEWVEPDRERFGLNWPGKAACMKVIQAPSVGTLKPCREESVDWDTTENLFIEGDNLEVLKLLQKAYFGKVKMIYIDPPYNTGNEFIYPDKYAETLDTYLEYTGQKDSEGRKFSTNTDTSGRFHSRWLNMMYPRLYLAKNLLREDGAIFISIDDNELPNLRKLCDEIFGEENFLCNFSWAKRYAPPPDTKDVGFQHENILFYRKSDAFSANLLPLSEEQKSRYKNPDNDPRGPWKAADYTCRYTADERPNLFYPITHPKTGEEIWPKRTRVWANSREVTEKNIKENRLWWGENGNNKTPALKNFLSEIRQGRMPSSLLESADVGHTDEAAKEFRSIFPDVKFTVKPTRLIKHFVQIATSENDVVLDFFAGSGTTADAILKTNKEEGTSRKFILLQLPEPCDEKFGAHKEGYTTVSSLCRERIRRVVKNMRSEASLPVGDFGFRAFRLDYSCFKLWDGNAEGIDDADLIQQIESHADHLDPNVAAEDILFELLLKDGFPLTVPIERIELAGKEVFSIAEGALLICLEKELTQELMDAMAEREPARVICLDAGFQGNDQLKANAVQTFKARARNKETAIEFRTV